MQAVAAPSSQQGVGVGGVGGVGQLQQQRQPIQVLQPQESSGEYIRHSYQEIPKLTLMCTVVGGDHNKEPFPVIVSPRNSSTDFTHPNLRVFLEI